jgi:hypothetical protein
MIKGERLKKFMCEGRMCMHKVAVFKESGKYRIEPGRLVVHPGARVVFVFLLGQAKPQLWLPPRLGKEVPAKPAVKGCKIVEIGDNTGVFPYEIFVPGPDGGDFAEGGSAGRIIVADP